MIITKLLKWLKEYEQVFQLKKIGLLVRKKGVNHVIILKKLELKSLSLISTKLEKQ